MDVTSPTTTGIPVLSEVREYVCKAFYRRHRRVKGDTSRPLQFYPSLNQHSPLTAHHRKEPPHHRPSGAFITLTTYSSGRIAFQWEDGIFQMAVSGCFYGAPGEIRTPDLVVRSHALYPTELRARIDTAGKTSLACGLTCSTGTPILHRYVI